MVSYNNRPFSLRDLAAPGKLEDGVWGECSQSRGVEGRGAEAGDKGAGGVSQGSTTDTEPLGGTH